MSSDCSTFQWGWSASELFWHRPQHLCATANGSLFLFLDAFAFKNGTHSINTIGSINFVWKMRIIVFLYNISSTGELWISELPDSRNAICLNFISPLQSFRRVIQFRTANCKVGLFHCIIVLVTAVNNHCHVGYFFDTSTTSLSRL